MLAFKVQRRGKLLSVGELSAYKQSMAGILLQEAFDSRAWSKDEIVSVNGVTKTEKDQRRLISALALTDERRILVLEVVLFRS